MKRHSKQNELIGKSTRYLNSDQTQKVLNLQGRLERVCSKEALEAVIISPDALGAENVKVGPKKTVTSFSVFLGLYGITNAYLI